MKLITFILTFLSIGQLCFGQEKSFYVPTYGNGETSLWFKWQQEKIKKAGLRNLTITNDTLHFRFATETQAIDIWTTNFLAFSGTITNFTTSYKSKNKNKKTKKGKFFSNSNPLDTNIARKVYELFKNKSIFEIPPQDSIIDWTRGKDGITYIIEHSTKNSYSFKDYWTPSHFKDKVDEAKVLQELTESLEELLNLGQSFGQFIKSLPYGAYRAGGYWITLHSKKKRK